MSAARIIVLSVAMVAAIGLAIVVRTMLVGHDPVAGAEAKVAEVPMARVLIAKRDLATGVRLTPADLGWQEWPASNLNATFITDGAQPAAAPEGAVEKAADGASQVVRQISGAGMDSVVGAIVREPILSGEPIQARKLVRGGEGGYLAVVLQPGMRAVGVPVTAETGAGGFILPGDRVDVIQSVEVENKDAPSTRVTRPVVMNVRVLAIDQATKPADDASSILGAVATLEVSPSAADALVEAIAEGDVQLALRAYTDASAPSGAAAGEPITPVQKTVKIYSQGETTEVAVTQ